jgi:nucleoid-associated protein YgaU
MSLTKATIEVLDTDAIDPQRGLTQFITVQFNPGEYTLDKKAQIADIAIPGIDSPIQQFVRGQTERLTLDLFFDVTDGGMGESSKDVTTLTRSIYQLVKIQPRTHAPPRVQFTWGQGLSFKAIVESVQQKVTLFNPLGVPLRATLSVAFREYKTLEEQVAELNLQSSDHVRTRVVRRGDRLDRIAGDEYGDPTAWRVIADANRLADPLHLTPGATLLLPRLDGPGQPGAGGGS